MSAPAFQPFTIQPYKNGGWEVVQDGKTTGALCFGEMLEMVVKLAMPELRDVRRYDMKTPEEWARRERDRVPSFARKPTTEQPS